MKAVKKKKKKVSLTETFDHLSYKFIASAVMHAFRTNQHPLHEKVSVKASSDSWCISTVLRRDILERTTARWCQLLNDHRAREYPNSVDDGEENEVDHTWFPFSEDYVAKLYMRFRKRSPASLMRFEKALNKELKIAAPKS